ncbi:hypothetical protein SAMN05421767_1512 [Granulicatella balaenopterae]|uniref:V/A-type H+-transporting ATPase subunit G/H n=1 Tax=Granulicatella balaenopterae TaxID=137733 RepID=A0A1H9P726_9LACT|nr:hypothetical protein [Granulicatella balaenopterae]SER43609.1 hypothetical protein SAMN05421767_1512 [Granulicatella balaenopterae]
MNENILQSIQGIEQEADQIKNSYINEIEKVKEATTKKIDVAKHNMEQALEEYSKELESKNNEKISEFTTKIREEESGVIQHLKARFEDKDEEFVQATVKEVLRRYGNC